MKESCYDQEQDWKDLSELTPHAEWDRCTDDWGLFSCYQKKNTVEPTISGTLKYKLNASNSSKENLQLHNSYLDSYATIK